MRITFKKLLILVIFSLLIIACGEKGKQSENGQTPVRQGTLHLFLIRHAQAFKNLKPLPDLPARQLDSLTAAGQKQAAALGRYLKDKAVTAIYASPTGRTRQTAQIIRQTAGLQDTVIIEKNLSSLYKGVMSLTPPMNAAQGRNDMNNLSEKGESLADGQQRVIRLISRLNKQYSDKAIVFVTHGDICPAVLAYAGGTSLSSADSLHSVPAGSVSELTIEPGGWTIKSEGIVP